jgi:sterol carrier protein 2
MATARERIEQTAQRIAENADEARQIDAVFRVVLDGAVGGTWLLDLRNDPGFREGGGEADCVIGMTADDCVELLEGQVSAQELYFRGKLKVKGDMGQAVKLRHLSRILR